MYRRQQQLLVKGINLQFTINSERNVKKKHENAQSELTKKCIGKLSIYINEYFIFLILIISLKLYPLILIIACSARVLLVKVNGKNFKIMIYI